MSCSPQLLFSCLNLPNDQKLLASFTLVQILTSRCRFSVMALGLPQAPFHDELGQLNHALGLIQPEAQHVQPGVLRDTFDIVLPVADAAGHLPERAAGHHA